MKKHILLLFAFLPLLQSCRKTETKPNEQFSYTFVNPQNERINVDVYRSKADYDAGIKALKLFIPANSSTVLNVPYLQNDGRYWVDWYNNSYSYTNWGMENTGVTVLNGSSYSILNQGDSIKKYKGLTRAVWLQKNKTSSTWQAVDAYRIDANGFYNEAWATLTDDKKKAGLAVDKGFNASYYTFSGTDSLATTGTYRPVNFGNIARLNLYSISGQMLAQANSYSGAVDTIAIRFMSDTTLWYKMIRQ